MVSRWQADYLLLKCRSRAAGRPAWLSFPSSFAVSQIVSINLETGKRTELTTGPGLKLSPQLLPDGRVGYITKVAQVSGIAYTQTAQRTFLRTCARPHGRLTASRSFTKKSTTRRARSTTILYSWDPDTSIRYTDVFPSFSSDGELLVTSKDTDSSIVVMNKDGSKRRSSSSPLPVARTTQMGRAARWKAWPSDRTGPRTDNGSSLASAAICGSQNLHCENHDDPS